MLQTKASQTIDGSVSMNWKAPDRYVELVSFEMEVANVFQGDVYDLIEEAKVPIIKTWLGRERLRFILTRPNVEKEACKSATGMFNILKENSGHSLMK